MTDVTMKVLNAKTGVVETVNPTAAQVNQEPKAPKKRMLEEEYNRRLESGFSYSFGPKDDRGTVFFKTTPKAQKGWERVTKRANALLAAGDGESVINVRTNGGKVKVTAPEWVAIMLYATEVEQALFEKFSALLDMSPIPKDFADDGYWT